MPAANHLYMVKSNCNVLDAEQAQSFHTLTAKLLFLFKRARLDIQKTEMTIVFLIASSLASATNFETKTRPSDATISFYHNSKWLSIHTSEQQSV